jgi:hypothetical protein
VFVMGGLGGIIARLNVSIFVYLKILNNPFPGAFNRDLARDLYEYIYWALVQDFSFPRYLFIILLFLNFLPSLNKYKYK